MKLIIAEKGVLAQQIIAAIGSEAKKINGLTYSCGPFVVTYLGGHVLTHVSPDEIDKKYSKWTLEDLPIYFPDWEKKPIDEKRGILDNVKYFLKDADTVIHAGDMDDEGQLLVDEVLDYCNYKGEVKRLNTADTTPKKLRESLKNLGENDVMAGYAAEARTLSDQVFGFTLSRYFTIKTGTKCNIGRVKCPTLGLVVKRDEEVEDFKQTTYYIPYFRAKCSNGSVKVKVEFPDDDEILDMSGYLSNVDKAVEFVKEHEGGIFHGDVVSEKVKDDVPMPYNLATLQLDCEKKFGYTPVQTLDITQNLRDKFNAISYNRSECEFLPDSYYENNELLRMTTANLIQIDEMKGVALKFERNDNFKAPCFDSSKVSLHFAIVPQEVKLDISKMNEQEKNVYKEICRRFLMQFVGPSIANRETLTVNLEKKRKAICRSLSYKDLGWKALLEDRKKSEEEMTIIPFVDTDRDYTLSDGELTESVTKPPKRYTEATLIADMCRISKFVRNAKIKALLLAKDEGKTGDKGSIGTSATRHTIVSDLITEGYFERTGRGNKFIKSTSKGRALFELLPDECKTADITANWFILQQEIAKGECELSKLPEKVRDETVDVMNDEHINFGRYARTIDESSCIGTCSCGGAIKETENSYFCTSCKKLVSKNDRYFAAFGVKMTEKIAVELLSKGKVKVRAYSKAKEKKYDKIFECTFEKANNDKGFMFPSYTNK